MGAQSGFSGEMKRPGLEPPIGRVDSAADAGSHALGGQARALTMPVPEWRRMLNWP